MSFQADRVGHEYHYHESGYDPDTTSIPAVPKTPVVSGSPEALLEDLGHVTADFARFVGHAVTLRPRLALGNLGDVITGIVQIGGRGPGYDTLRNGQPATPPVHPGTHQPHP